MQQICDNLARQRGGQVSGSIQRWDAQMRRHHARQPTFDKFTKRVQFERINANAVVRNHGRVGVGVHARVAVARKVLGRGQQAAVVHSFHVGVGFFKNAVLVFTKRPKINNGVVGVVIDIGHGGKINVHSHPFGLPREGLPHFVDQLVVSLNGAQCHLVGKPHGAV